MDLPKPLPSHMRIKLRRADAGMPKEFLDHTKVRPMFKQMRRETMPQHMRRDIPGDPRMPHASLNSPPHRRRAEAAAAFGQEKCPRTFGANPFGAANFKVTVNRGDRVLADGHNPFFVPLANDGEKARIKMQILDAQTSKFGKAQTAGVSHLQNRLVAKRIRGFRRQRRQQLSNLIVTQRFGQPLPTARQAQILGDVVREKMFAFAKLKERAQRRNLEVETARGQFRFRFGGGTF